jgi:NAD(P)-dependent dehydrogenase (short-subunit alcohol dehydrogenase family)
VGFTIEDIPDLSGRVAVVTGANGGLGLETARALAGAGAHVVMAARDQAKAADARASIEATHPKASLEVVPLDLGSQQSVEDAAGRVLAAHDTVDLLVNNAGVMAVPRRETAEGYEMQFGVNHLGHWTLTALLLPAILRPAEPPARVVTVTSVARHMGRAVNPADPHLREGYDEWRAYGRAKLANYLFAIGLQRRFDAAGVAAMSLAAHPGLSNTNLQAQSVEASGGGASQRFFHRLTVTAGMPPAVGALSQLRAATDPTARGGELYGPRFTAFGPPARLPVLRHAGLAKAIDTLWAVSERETGIALDVPPA